MAAHPPSFLVVVNIRHLWCGGDSANRASSLHNASLVCRNERVVWLGEGSAGAIQYLQSHNDNIDVSALQALLFLSQQQPGDVDSHHLTRHITVLPNRDQSSATQNQSGGIPLTLIDCHGSACVVPGFIDSHVHLIDAGRRLVSVSLRECRSRSEFVQTLREFIETTHPPKGTWITGGDWNDARLGETPDKSWIDEVTEDHFVLLSRIDSHAAVVNSKVLLQGVSPSLLDDTCTTCEGGTIVRDPVTNLPTGLLKEKAVQLVKRGPCWPPRDTPENLTRALLSAGAYLNRLGITAVHTMTSLDFGNMDDIVTMSHYVETNGKLPVRVRCAVRETEIDAALEFLKAHPQYDGRPGKVNPSLQSGYLQVGMVKFFTDGSLGSKTAAMKQPYRNCCECGYLLQPREALQRGVEIAVQHGFQCCLHAIGDAAVETAVGCLAEATEKFALENATTYRHRIEHCQHIDVTSGVLRQMADLGIIASCQPCHLLFDGDYAESLLGEVRKHNSSYLLRTFSSNRIPCCLGSDWMVAPADVVDAGIRAAVTRVPDAIHATHRVRWNDDECLTVAEALRGYTETAAFAGFDEHRTGRISEGFLADFVIISEDLLQYDTQPHPVVDCSDDPLQTWRLATRNCSVVATILGGEVVFWNQGLVA